MSRPWVVPPRVVELSDQLIRELRRGRSPEEVARECGLQLEGELVVLPTWWVAHEKGSYFCSEAPSGQQAAMEFAAWRYGPIRRWPSAIPILLWRVGIGRDGRAVPFGVQSGVLRLDPDRHGGCRDFVVGTN
jgi:hypothetical protein